MRLRIREICNRFGLTASELADRCGVAQPALSDYDLGKRNPTLKTMQKIAGPLGISVRELIEERDDIDRDIDWFLSFPLEERLRISERDSTEIDTLRDLS